MLWWLGLLLSSVAVLLSMCVGAPVLVHDVRGVMRSAYAVCLALWSVCRCFSVAVRCAVCYAVCVVL